MTTVLVAGPPSLDRAHAQSAGTYVARAFENDTYAKLDESNPFAVQ